MIDSGKKVAWLDGPSYHEAAREQQTDTSGPEFFSSLHPGENREPGYSILDPGFRRDDRGKYHPSDSSRGLGAPIRPYQINMPHFRKDKFKPKTHWHSSIRPGVANAAREPTEGFASNLRQEIQHHYRSMTLFPGPFQHSSGRTNAVCQDPEFCREPG